MPNDERAYSWDEPVINEPKEGGDFTLLPAGVYPFRVVKFERGRFDGSEKMSPCPKAMITVEIDGGDLGTTQRTENLFLHSKCEGILCSFFVSVGLRKHGEALDVRQFNKILGRKGRCKVDVQKFTRKDGTTGESNQVKSWLEPTEAEEMVVSESGEDLF